MGGGVLRSQLGGREVPPTAGKWQSQVTWQAGSAAVPLPTPVTSEGPSEVLVHEHSLVGLGAE